MNVVKCDILIWWLTWWYFLLKNRRLSELKELFNMKYNHNEENEINTIPVVTDIHSIWRNGIIITTIATNELSIKEYHLNTL